SSRSSRRGSRRLRLRTRPGGLRVFGRTCLARRGRMRKAHLLRWRPRPFLRRMRHTPRSGLGRRLASGPFSFARPALIDWSVRKETTMRLGASLPLVLVLVVLALVASGLSAPDPVWAGPLDMPGAPQAMVCSACHGFAGQSRSNTMPILAGIAPWYFKKAIQDYAAGKRT